MYKLMIKDLAGIWRVADTGDDKPAMTYQANNIAELKDRQSDYSQSVSLPMSPNNISIFGYSNVVGSTTGFPYTKHDCRLFANGSTLAGKGSVFLLTSITSTFNGQILSGIVDIFKLLEDSPMSDLDLGYFPRTPTGMNPSNFGGIYEFAIASFTRGGVSYAPSMDNKYMLPFVKDMRILNAIFSNLGYTWVHNLDQYPEFLRYAKPVVNNLSSADSFGSDFDGLASIDISRVTTSANYIYYVPIIQSDIHGSLTLFGADGSPAPGGTTFIANMDCNISVNIAGSYNTSVVPPDSRPYFEINIVTNLAEIATNELAYRSVTSVNGVDVPFLVNRTYTLAKGDSINIKFAQQTGNTVNPAQSNLVSTIEFSDFNAGTVPIYGSVEISKNLGFDNQASYLKSMLQMLGLTIYVDEGTKTIYTYTMQELYDNKPIAVDWSDKLHLSKEGNLSFTLGKYGQTNNILFKDNSEDNVTDKGFFNVSNETLEASVDLFTIDIESGKDVGAVPKANIPIFDMPGLTATPKTYEAELKAGKPHQIVLSEATSQGYVETSIYLYHTANHVTVQHLINTFYPKLTGGLLLNAKVLTEYFLLKSSDIEAFNPFVPIYVRKFGAYFYVNKISNFIENQLTEVELIKL